jgi:hypothetical protein
MYGELSQVLLAKLIDAGVVGAKGGAKFGLLGLDVKVEESSAVGYLIQEWLAAWMTSQEIQHSSPDDSQKSPDFYLGNDKQTDILEVKVFRNNPGFDIANFEAYLDLLIEKPEHLDADYLIFEYDLVRGDLEIKNVWLKKVWEITRQSAEYPLYVQKKRDVIYNIRPGNWRATRAKYRTFENRDDFLRALFGTEAQYRGVRMAQAWKQKFVTESGIEF